MARDITLTLSAVEPDPFDQAAATSGYRPALGAAADLSVLVAVTARPGAASPGEWRLPVNCATNHLCSGSGTCYPARRRAPDTGCGTLSVSPGPCRSWVVHDTAVIAGVADGSDGVAKNLMDQTFEAIGATINLS